MQNLMIGRRLHVTTASSTKGRTSNYHGPKVTKHYKQHSALRETVPKLDEEVLDSIRKVVVGSEYVDALPEDERVEAARELFEMLGLDIESQLHARPLVGNAANFSTNIKAQLRGKF